MSVPVEILSKKTGRSGAVDMLHTSFVGLAAQFVRLWRDDPEVPSQLQAALVSAMLGNNKTLPRPKSAPPGKDARQSSVVALLSFLCGCLSSAEQQGGSTPELTPARKLHNAAAPAEPPASPQITSTQPHTIMRVPLI